MIKNNDQTSNSIFNELGYKKTVEILLDEICNLYLDDRSPWIIGYSGGKDSTTVLQLVWASLLKLPKEKRTNPVYVISTDTMVENPVVSNWVAKTLESMKKAAESERLPIYPHRLLPETKDSFWVNLLGKGYPAPRPLFRWCTSRLKINPSNKFILDIVNKTGKAILVLGMRKTESSIRAQVMKKYEKNRIQDRLSPNSQLPLTSVYTPIEDWYNDDVWAYLLENRMNPWKGDNHDLLKLYKGASPDNECPLVVDSGTPSCGTSRFGCWVCTLVSKDASMQAMIQNDDEKEWLIPMLEFRDSFDIQNDRKWRDFRRMSGAVQLYQPKTNNDASIEPQFIPGPYLQTARESFLRRLLETQKLVQQKKPASVPDFELITIEELSEIRRIWLSEKHESEDSLPKIYEEVFGREFPGASLEENLILGKEEIPILKDICGDNLLHFELTRALIDIEKNFRTKANRAGLFDQLESTIRKHFYDDEKDAKDRALRKRIAIERALPFE